MKLLENVEMLNEVGIDAKVSVHIPKWAIVSFFVVSFPFLLFRTTPKWLLDFGRFLVERAGKYKINDGEWKPIGGS